MHSQEDVECVIHEYTYRTGYLADLDEVQCLQVGVNLWKSGRVIEPRSNGISALQVPAEFVWMDLYPTEANLKNEGVKKAWNAYRTLITLSEQIPEADSSAVKHGSRLTNLDDVDPEIMKALII